MMNLIFRPRFSYFDVLCYMAMVALFPTVGWVGIVPIFLVTVFISAVGETYVTPKD